MTQNQPLSKPTVIGKSSATSTWVCAQILAPSYISSTAQRYETPFSLAPGTWLLMAPYYRLFPDKWRHMQKICSSMLDHLVNNQTDDYNLLQIGKALSLHPTPQGFSYNTKGSKFHH